MLRPASDLSEAESGYLNDTHPSRTDVTPTRPRDETATSPPPPLGTTPMSVQPAIDTRGMPLPRRVDEIDLGATQVTPVAYQQQTSVGSYPPAKPATNSPQFEAIAKPPRQIDWSGGLGCLLRMTVLGIFGMVILGIGSGSFMLYQYYSDCDCRRLARCGHFVSKFCTI